MEWFHQVVEFVRQLLNPESIVKFGGLTLLTVVIFAETGLLIGFFLPGDSLLFTAGLLTATGFFKAPIEQTLLLMTIAALAGDQVGYFIGRRVGPAVFNRKESLLFKPQYVTMTREFYAKHGSRALVIGRFIPIIRTFNPVFAGVVAMDYRKFTTFSVMGGILWINSVTLLAYFIGRRFPWIKDYLEYIIIVMIVVTTIPFIRTVLKEMKEAKARKADAEPVTK